jgi:plastocyanin
MSRAGSFLGFALVLGASVRCAAASLEVNVVDERGKPVEHVVVYAVPNAPVSLPAGGPASELSMAVMDQGDNAFLPHLLVVQAGTEVLFPNNDTVSHHVYSFSQAKRFELGLYKGDAYPPVRFETPGVVVLGCNIHDGMLGYIVVVDTPHFALTDSSGTAMLDGLAAGAYTLDIWTQRARPNTLPPASSIAVTESESAAVAFQLRGKLLPTHDHNNTGLSWERY